MFACLKEQNFSTNEEQRPPVASSQNYMYPSSSESVHSVWPETSRNQYSPIAVQGQSLNFLANFDF